MIINCDCTPFVIFLSVEVFSNQLNAWFCKGLKSFLKLLNSPAVTSSKVGVIKPDLRLT